jgi:hypothetical protein
VILKLGDRLPVLILGTPAKVVRELNNDELTMIGDSASACFEKSAVYRDRLVSCAPRPE